MRAKPIKGRRRTRWQSRHRKPRVVGVYERKYDGKVLLSYWDGWLWGFTERQNDGPASVYDAFMFSNPVSGEQYLPWRGLTDAG